MNMCPCLRQTKSFCSSILYLGSIWLLGTASIRLHAQPPSPLPEAYDALHHGLILNAQRLIERGREHPDSNVRQEATLLQGYLFAKSGRDKEALREWYALSQRSPHSVYGMEAAFWRADLLLKQVNSREAALYLLRTLIESPQTPPDLRAAVERRLEYFFWQECDLGCLWHYALHGHPTLYPFVQPALLYQLRQGCHWRLWRVWEQFHKETCGELPDSLRLDTLMLQSPVETLRVALLLPLMASQERLSPFLEFWQGFELGIAEGKSPYAAWIVRVEDTERNPLRIQELLDEWTTEPPDIVIGEVSWTLNQPIADFCERHGIWHAIPINPAYPRRSTAIPLVPPASCVGWQLSEKISTEGLGGGVLLYEEGDPLAQALVEGFRSRNWIPAYPVPGNLAGFISRWTTLADSIRGAQWYGVFISDEEVVSYLLHTVNLARSPSLIIGMENWSLFKRTDLRDYRRLRIWVPESLIPDSVLWSAFERKARSHYGKRITFFHAQGYDAANLLTILTQQYERAYIPRAEYAGILNLYTVPPACERYRIKIWEYDRGEFRIREGP